MNALCPLAIACVLAGTLPVFGQTTPMPQPRSLAYVLQAEGLAVSREAAVQRLADCGRDWIVLDVFFDGSADGGYTAEEIGRIRDARRGRKVLAYLSIGEAEDYRPYWKREWDADGDGRPDTNAPPWLAKENPDWKGNYRVRYWNEDWQAIVFGLLDRMIRAGFDGAYLDTVDAFESFEYDPLVNDWIDHRRNAATGRTYREDTIRWVCHLAEHARRRNPGFIIIPQNGAQLLENPEYRAAISGIGVEDLFTVGDRFQKREHTRSVVGFLNRLNGEGKPVFVIEYGTKPAWVRASLLGARENGYVLLVTDRELKTLGRSGDGDGKENTRAQ